MKSKVFLSPSTVQLPEFWSAMQTLVGKAFYNAKPLLLAALLFCCCPWASFGDSAKPTLPEIRSQLLETEKAPDQTTVDSLAAAIEADPANIEARCLLGIAYDKLGLPDLALEQFKLALQNGPDDPHMWVVMIKREFLSGHSDFAMHLIQSAHERFPTDAEVLFWYGNYYAAHQVSDKAAYAYQLALKQNRNIEGLRSALAELNIANRRYGDAVRLAEEELRRNPNVWIAYKAKGLGLFGLGAKCSAIAPLRIAFDRLPRNGDVTRCLAESLLWCGHAQESLYPALVYLNSSSSDSGTDPKAKALLGEVIAKLPKQIMTDNFLQQASNADLRARNPVFHFALGDVLDRRGYCELAMVEYTRGLQRMPQFARGLFRLGCDYESFKRDYDNALPLLEQAHRLAPNDLQIGARLDRLRQRIEERDNDLAWICKDWVSKRLGRK